MALDECAVMALGECMWMRRWCGWKSVIVQAGTWGAITLFVESRLLQGSYGHKSAPSKGFRRLKQTPSHEDMQVNIES
eukprot:249170-Pelagomonas_calceolata.AAC.4